MARRTGNMVLDALLAGNPTARAFDRALENTERNMGPVTLMGTWDPSRSWEGSPPRT